LNEAIPAPARPLYLRPLPDFLFRADGRRGIYILKAWLLALLPSLVLAQLISSVLPDSQLPDLPPIDLLGFLALVVFAPMVETLLMVLPLLLLQRLFGPGPAVLLSAVGWGIVHSLAAPMWGLVVWWPLLVMSIALLTWRERGIWVAMAVVVAIHALQNGFAATLLLAAGR
jgi:membrane protease YdiL (CAAX protease family)